MNTIKATAARYSAMLDGIAKNLGGRLADLGVRIVVRDDSGTVLNLADPHCEFCQAICSREESCPLTTAQAAQRAQETKRPELANSTIGCSIVALPIKRRRRVIGSITACMPISSMLEEEHLARTCDRLELDREVMDRLGRQACRKAGITPRQLAGLLEHMLDTETSCHTSTQELGTLSHNLAATYEELSLVYRISGSMQLTQSPQGYLKNVCQELVEVMGVSTAVAIIHPAPGVADGRDTVVVAGGCGLDEEQLALLASKYMAPRFGPENLGVVDNHFVHAESQWAQDQIQRVVSVPLVSDGPRSGILIGINKLNREFDSIDLKLLRSIGNQSAVFLANSRLYGDLEDLLMGVLHALSATIDAKDPYTCGHSRRVAFISRRLAEKIGFNAERVHRIYLAGLLHDIGKIGVPESTLCKAGKLTDEEYTQMKSHPLLGAKILGGIRQLDDIIPGILCHHERLDGKGYPNGLNSGELSMDSLIVGLADSFDAMTSDRTYRNALPIDVVRKEIEENAGLQFAPSLVAEMLSWDLEALLDELHRPAEMVGTCDEPGRSE